MLKDLLNTIVIILSLLIHIPCTAIVLPKFMNLRALNYLHQAQQDCDSAYTRLIKTTLGHVYGSDTKTVQDVGQALDLQLLQNYGLLAAHLNHINHKLFKPIPTKFTANILNTLSPYVTSDLTARPEFFYTTQLLAEPIKISGADLLVSRDFKEFSPAAKQFLVLQKIKLMSSRAPLLASSLTGIRFKNYQFDFNQPQLDHYRYATIHLADLTAAVKSPKMLHSGLEALTNSKLEPIIPDTGVPSLYNRRVKLYELFERLQDKHQFYGTIDQDTR